MRTIRLMADYQCFPLWEASPGKVGNINPGSLPISHDLQTGLAMWAKTYDLTLNMDDPASSGFESDDAEASFKKIGNELAVRLRDELGPGFTVKVKL